MAEKNDNNMEKLVSLCKRRGFIFPGSEVYGGLKGTWDFGPLGVALSRNIKNEWWKFFVERREDMYGVDAAILMNPRVWEASGHTGAGFADPMVEDLENHKRYRADHLLEENGIEEAETLSIDEMNALIEEKGILSPDGNALSSVRKFNMMFETKVGSVEDTASTVYIRPETAQGMFVNFKNVLDSQSPKIPFGLAQIGKAFRNEITPRDFIFRLRELEQMEIEYFVREEEWEAQFEYWHGQMKDWMTHVGLSENMIHELEVPETDRAHYSKRTVDFEFEFPFGVKELYGLAYRTDHDLKSHMEASGTSMEYIEPDGNRFIPHVIEPTFGVERTILAVLLSAYHEDEMNGEVRTVLKLPTHLAPYRVAVSPLLRNKPALVEKAREVFTLLKQEYGNVAWDDNGNVGKRYRRQDEIGTPACVVIDFDTIGEEDPSNTDTVTVRHRDTGAQERVAIGELVSYLK